MKLIVGLGNPGVRYEHTRHNVGFDVVDLLATRWQVRVATEKFHGWFGKGEIAGASAVLLKPTTLMNRSGRAVVAAGRFYKLEIADLMVVVDDLALPVGRIRVRMGGSSGGHNGLQDIIDRAGSDAWCRTRIGIGVPAGDPVRYVLGRFDPQEEEVMRPTCERGADAVECWVAHGVDETMNRFNADPTRG